MLPISPSMTRAAKAGGLSGPVPSQRWRQAAEDVAVLILVAGFLEAMAVLFVLILR